MKPIPNKYSPDIPHIPHIPPEVQLFNAIFGEDQCMPLSFTDMMPAPAQREKTAFESNFVGWKKEGTKYRKIEYFKADRIPSGVYEIAHDDNGPIFKVTDFPTDNLMLLP